jgi:16S rRNA (guanine966-N2)-methyltransferase
VGGQHRGRQLETPDDLPIRPTSDRARESLFNILEHGRMTKGGLSPIRGARVLDAFCGTGALGLEALSRGAAHAVFIDRDPAALRLARHNAARLGVSTEATFLLADATHPPRADQPCTLVFLDPPYHQDLVAPSTSALMQAGWIGPGAIVVAELARREKLRKINELEEIDARLYGKTQIIFYRALNEGA